MSTLNVGKRIIDYIIDQAEIYDNKNIDFELAAIGRFMRVFDHDMGDLMDSTRNHHEIRTQLQLETYLRLVTNRVTDMYNAMYKAFIPNVQKHMESGYEYMKHLIEIGMELETEAKNMAIHEIQKKVSMPDQNAVEYVRQHALDMVKDMSDEIINKARQQLGMRLTQGVINRGQLANEMSEILGVSYKRAQTIAQTELSFAYNAGAMQRMSEFNSTGGGGMMKYWHGFKYSERTCTYCRPRIGNTYTIEDDSEVLPAHPKCRCIWLPFMNGWDRPISTIFTRNADMIRRSYSPEDVYKRINQRLDINYGNYIPIDDALDYLAGDRSASMVDKLAVARDMAIKDIVESLGLKTDPEEPMGREFNQQAQFWRKYVAGQVVDNNRDTLSKAYEAIKGIMILPWTPGQLQKWDDLLTFITRYL